MRFVTYRHEGRERVGAVAGDRVCDLQAAYAACLADDPRGAELAALRIPTELTSFIAGLEPSWTAAREAVARPRPRPSGVSQ